MIAHLHLDKRIYDEIYMPLLKQIWGFFITGLSVHKSVHKRNPNEINCENFIEKRNDCMSITIWIYNNVWERTGSMATMLDIGTILEKLNTKLNLNDTGWIWLMLTNGTNGTNGETFNRNWRIYNSIVDCFQVDNLNVYSTEYMRKALVSNDDAWLLCYYYENRI